MRQITSTGWSPFRHHDGLSRYGWGAEVSR